MPDPQQSGMALPPGATLVRASPADESPKLPPGATLVSVTPQSAAAPAKPQTHTDARTGEETAGGEPLREGTMGAGFVKEALKTASGVSSLFGIGKTATPAETETRGMAEGVGGLVENAAEFAAGDEALKGLASFAKTPEWILNLANKYPKIAKYFLPAAKSSAVGAVQGAAKGAQTDEALKGAEGGAVGAAIGHGAGELVGAAVKPIANKMGLWTTAEEDALRVFRPARRNIQFAQDWQRAAPLLKQEVEEGGKFENIGQAVERINDVRNQFWEDRVAPAIERHSADALDTKPVVQAIRDRITPEMRLHAPKEAEAIEDFASRFAGGRALSSAESELQFLNADLQARGYYKMTPAERAAIDKTNGEISARSAAVDALRDAMYDHLENSEEKGIRELKQTYGALKNVGNALSNQVNVAGRQQPVSLKQVVSMAGGLGPTTLALADKLYNSPDALLNRAVSKAVPSETRVAAGRAVNLAGEAAKKAAPVAGAAAGRAAARSNQERPNFTAEAERRLGGGQ